MHGLSTIRRNNMTEEEKAEYVAHQDAMIAKAEAYKKARFKVVAISLIFGFVTIYALCI